MGAKLIDSAALRKDSNQENQIHQSRDLPTKILQFIIHFYPRTELEVVYMIREEVEGGFKDHEGGRRNK